MKQENNNGCAAITAQQTTTEYGAESECQYDFTAQLCRLSTGETMAINSELFRIGKKNGIANFVVQGNSAISRLHADIVHKNSRFFIKDNQSTNGTYIWDVKIPAQEEIEIFDGDEIKLANECFEFHLI